MASKESCARIIRLTGAQFLILSQFFTRALEKGVDVKVVAEWQGHTDGGKLILDTYSHVSRQHATRMAQLMTTE